MRAVLKKNWLLFGIAALTLGLAPFTPEPHLWGKLKWIAGGAHGMKTIDWFDFFMHSLPSFLLLLSGGINFMDWRKQNV